jgi:putative hydrolase of the HAD superfamily
MGGVLVEIDWHGKISKLLGQDIPFEQIHVLWGASPSVNEFEHGRMGFEEFAKAFIVEQGLTLTETAFKQEFMDIVVGDFPGVCELLEALQKNYTISLLSNTNTAHWNRIVEQNTFLRFVDHPFTSLQFGIMKPNPAIYHRLIQELNCRPDEILFFDDGLINVEAARAIGINAEQTIGLDQVKGVLRRHAIPF